MRIIFFKPLGSFDRELIGPFRRNFGNSLDQCLNPIQHPPNFCTSQNVPDDAPTSFVRYRTINGTCNNLRRGRATFGAAGIVAARFLPHSMYIWKYSSSSILKSSFSLYLQKIIEKYI